MENSLEFILISKLEKYKDFEPLIDAVLEDTKLSEMIIKRSLVEQYITNFNNKLNQKRKYYKKYILEINDQIKNAYLVGYEIDHIYDLIVKSYEKIEAVLFEMNLYSKIDNYQVLLVEYIQNIITNLNSDDVKLRSKIIKQMLNNDKGNNKHLNIEEKKILIINAIEELKANNLSINYTSISQKTKRHPRTIKKYMSQLRITF